VEQASRCAKIFKTRWVERFARKQRITDAVLVGAIARIEEVQVDANLGGDVIKRRIARPGHGKSGGTERSSFSAITPVQFSPMASQRVTGRPSTATKRSS
jgi:hypothetical protein